MSAALSVVTLNLLADLRRWDERKHMLVDEFRALSPDLIALQEASLVNANAHWLAAQLGGYSVLITQKTNKKQPEGVAILSRLPIVKTDWISLGTQQRVANLVELNVNGQSVLFVCGHFYWYPGAHGKRLQQVQVLLSWLRKQSSPTMSVIVCGDFNGTPDDPAIQFLRTEFSSAYAATHGNEPEWTCPTPLQWKQDAWRQTVFEIVGLAKTKVRQPWRGTLDYIFVNQRVRVTNCRVVFNTPAPHDATLYPSDHLGLWAMLEMG